MNITHIFSLLGGLALFLYGMQMMSSGLEEAAGNRMKGILEKLTSNRFLGVIVGAAITAVIQSSSATTVMVVGFVNTGIMTLRQAVWIIMGANIGTTITGQLISLDVKAIAPMIAFLGVAAIMFLKKPMAIHVGKIMAGFGVLFIGMDMMGSAMYPLRESETFISLMTKFSNPLLGILAGAVFTAVIQSSSASVGILQTLAISGLIGLDSAVYVLFGQNIGTCITAVIASVGTNRSAKRTTIIHLTFNILGTAIFTALCMAVPVTELVSGITPDNPAAQIANMHTIFNIVTTCLLLPFGTGLAGLAEKILPDMKASEDEERPLMALAEEINHGRGMLGTSAIHMDVLRQEVRKILSLAQTNVDNCFRAVLRVDTAAEEEIAQTEEKIDVLNKDIAQYISKILVHNHTGDDVEAIEQYMLISGNAERIGDHAQNIGDYVRTIAEKSITFSRDALDEMQKMQEITSRALTSILNPPAEKVQWLSEIAAIEQRIDDMTDTYRETHLARMKSGQCSEEGCILYSELLTDFERIGDHVLNIAEAYTKMAASTN